MNKIYLLLLFLSAATSAPGQLFLTEPINVSTEGTGTRAPRIALLEGNRPIVYWGKTGSSAAMYLAIWEDGDFNQPIQLNTNGIEPDLWGGGLGPQIAAQENLIFLVFENYGQGIYCIKSADGGVSFSDPITVFDPPAGRFATLPSVAIKPDGNPIVSFVTTNSAEGEALYEITTSEDGGATFLPTTVANMAASGSEVCECCPASLVAMDGEEVYLGFRNNDNDLRDIWVAKSDDGGTSFPEATDIDATDWVIQSCPQSGPDIMVGNDQIHSVFYSAADGVNIYFSSLDKNTMEAGDQFQIPAVSGADKNQNYPVVAGSGDTLAVVWQESSTFGWDIMMTWSANGADELLQNPMIIEDANLSQRQPDVVYADGQFHMVYEDQLAGRVVYRIASFEEVVSTTNLPKNRLSFGVHPNPFQDKTTVFIENPENDLLHLTLTNLNGQTIFETKGILNQQEISGLPKGIYFVKVQKGAKVLTEKIVVQ